MSYSISNNIKKKFNFAKEKIKYYNGYNLTPYTPGSNLLNLSPGPTALPQVVMNDIIDEFNNSWTLGATPLEISHRSPEFLIIKNSCEQLFRDLLKIPSNFSLIWTHGGGHGQFSAVPLNLVKSIEDEPDYIVTGTWSNRSYLEARKFCHANKITEKEDLTEINTINRDLLIEAIKNSKSEYIYICSNETINGIEFREDGLSIPSKKETNNKKMIVDMSSDILSKNLNWNNIDVAFACAPKNFGFPGSAITIIENSFLTDEYNSYYKNNIPSLLDWKLIKESNSFWNTLPVFNIYVTEKILKYYEKIGGLKTIQSDSTIKANMLYTLLDRKKEAE
jgi:phosphoserine aminotransferase